MNRQLVLAALFSSTQGQAVPTDVDCEDYRVHEQSKKIADLEAEAAALKAAKGDGTAAGLQKTYNTAAAAWEDASRYWYFGTAIGTDRVEKIFKATAEAAIRTTSNANVSDTYVHWAAIMDTATPPEQTSHTVSRTIATVNGVKEAKNPFLQDYQVAMLETHKATKRWKEHCDFGKGPTDGPNNCVVPAGPSPAISSTTDEPAYTVESTVASVNAAYSTITPNQTYATTKTNLANAEKALAKVEALSQSLKNQYNNLSQELLLYATPDTNLNVATHYGITMLPKQAALWPIGNNSKDRQGLCCDAGTYYNDVNAHNGHLKDWNTARDARWAKNTAGESDLTALGFTTTTNAKWKHANVLSWHKIWDENSILGLTATQRFNPKLFTDCQSQTADCSIDNKLTNTTGSFKSYWTARIARIAAYKVWSNATGFASSLTTWQYAASVTSDAQGTDYHTEWFAFKIKYRIWLSAMARNRHLRDICSGLITTATLATAGTACSVDVLKPKTNEDWFPESYQVDADSGVARMAEWQNVTSFTAATRFINRADYISSLMSADQVALAPHLTTGAADNGKTFAFVGASLTYYGAYDAVVATATGMTQYLAASKILEDKWVLEVTALYTDAKKAKLIEKVYDKLMVAENLKTDYIAKNLLITNEKNAISVGVPASSTDGQLFMINQQQQGLSDLIRQYETNLRQETTKLKVLEDAAKGKQDKYIKRTAGLAYWADVKAKATAYSGQWKDVYERTELRLSTFNQNNRAVWDAYKAAKLALDVNVSRDALIGGGCIATLTGVCTQSQVNEEKVKLLGVAKLARAAHRETCKAFEYSFANQLAKDAAAQKSTDAATSKTMKAAYDDANPALAAGTALGARCEAKIVDKAPVRTPCAGAAESTACCGSADKYLRDGSKMTIETCQALTAKEFTYAPPFPAGALEDPQPETWKFQCISASHKLMVAATAAVSALYLMQ